MVIAYDPIRSFILNFSFRTQEFKLGNRVTHGSPTTGLCHLHHSVTAQPTLSQLRSVAIK
jgi:hypothetical protein